MKKIRNLKIFKKINKNMVLAVLTSVTLGTTLTSCGNSEELKEQKSAIEELNNQINDSKQEEIIYEIEMGRKYFPDEYKEADFIMQDFRNKTFHSKLCKKV